MYCVSEDVPLWASDVAWCGDEEVPAVATDVGWDHSGGCMVADRFPVGLGCGAVRCDCLFGGRLWILRRILT